MPAEPPQAPGGTGDTGAPVATALGPGLLTIDKGQTIGRAPTIDRKARDRLTLVTLQQSPPATYRASARPSGGSDQQRGKSHKNAKHGLVHKRRDQNPDDEHGHQRSKHLEALPAKRHLG